MRRMLLCCGLNGDETALGQLKRTIEERKPEGVLFAGGFCSPEMSKDERGDWWLKVLKTLGQTGVYVAFVPGEHDGPLGEYLVVAMNSEVDFPGLHSAHATLHTDQDFALAGVGGRLTEHANTDGLQLAVSRPVAEYLMRGLTNSDASRRILLLHTPPKGALENPPEGTDVAEDLVLTVRPHLCVVCGDTERRGVQQVAHTYVVNPGQLKDGWAAWFDWTKPAGEQVELLSVG